ncbi:MAG: hypothetical protein MK193_04155 [Lentisphaeria bacterium]|nr:hypothetical protein [Lentisphaeria bacterium]
MKYLCVCVVILGLSMNQVYSQEEANVVDDSEATVPTTASNDSDFVKALKEGKSRIAIGNFTSFGKAKDDDFAVFGRVTGKKTIAYSNTYFEAFYETGKLGEFQLGIGTYANFKTWDLQDTYQERIENDEHIYLTDIYLKFHFSEDFYIQGGRFNVREISNRFDPQYGQGVLAQYENDNNTKFQLGALNKFASFWNDSVYDFEGVDEDYRYDFGDPEAADDVDDVIIFAEYKQELNENIQINPYIYYQDNYVGWYGLDTKFTFGEEKTKYGTSVFAYFLDSQLESDVLDDSEKNSWNYSINPFLHYKHWRYDLGFSQFGDNAYFNNPSWGYKYFSYVLYEDYGSLEVMDYNGVYGAESTDMYFGRVGYHTDNWALGISAAYYEPSESQVVDDIWELQVGGNTNITEHLNIGARFVSVIADEKSGVEGRDINYVEAWFTYVF